MGLHNDVHYILIIYSMLSVEYKFHRLDLFVIGLNRYDKAKASFENSITPLICSHIRFRNLDEIK